MGKKSRRTKSAKKGSNAGGVRKQQSIVTYAPDTSKFGPTPSPEKVTTFWDWFKTNESALCNLSHAAMAKRIDAELLKVDPGLSYELGTRHNGSFSEEKYQNHLIISAGGMKEHFNAVIEVIRAAPTDLGNWRFTAFRDRKCDDDTTVGFQGKMYPRRNIRYALSKDDRRDKIGIWLFMKGFEGDYYALPEHEREFFGQVGFLYLDSILGEYDVEMHIGEVVLTMEHETNPPFAD